ncbi:MAG TPA: NAD(P)-dependent oxidoreductase [Acidimicrobiia bacterium]
MVRLGFIGLGTMGRGMVSNLISAGHTPTVWNRTTSRCEGIDAPRATSPADLGSQCDVIFICVSDTPDVEEVTFGPDGAVHDMAPGSIIVDHSTISPVATEELAARAAEKGVSWVDAPVSGGSEGAERGTLAVMAGGPAEALERVRPFLDAYSNSVVHVGEAPGSGQMAKTVNQVLVVINALAVSEALLLADAAGLDLQTTLSAIEGGAAGSWMLSHRGPQVIARDWRPGFTIDLQVKDLRIALETADRLGIPMPGLALTFQLYKALQSRGLGGEGNHALIKAIEEMAGRKLGSAE